MKEVKDDVHDIKHVYSKYIQGNNIGRYLNSPDEYGRTYAAIRNKFAVNKWINFGANMAAKFFVVLTPGTEGKHSIVAFFVSG